MTLIEDQKLIAQYLSGDQQSLALLVRKYLTMVYRMAWRYVKNDADAEDVTQTVFVKMWKNLKHLDRSQSFQGWLLTIAKNAAIDFCRRQTAMPFSAFTDETGDNILAQTIADSAPLADEIVDNVLLGETLTAAVRLLLPKYRQIITWHHQGFNFQEIAELSGESVNTVKSRYRRAMLQLRKLLTDVNT